MKEISGLRHKFFLKMRTMIVTMYKAMVRIRGDNVCKALITVPTAKQAISKR